MGVGRSKTQVTFQRLDNRIDRLKRVSITNFHDIDPMSLY